jgi:hypothetical protein
LNQFRVEKELLIDGNDPRLTSNVELNSNNSSVVKLFGQE